MKSVTVLLGTAAAAAISLSLAGCVPPYIEALDRAAPLTRQMTAVGLVGPISLSNSATGVRFLPAKPTATSLSGLNLQSGFLIQDSGGSENLSFAYVDSSGKGQNSSYQSFSLSGANPNYPLYDYQVTNTIGGVASVIVFKYDPTTIANSTYAQFVAPLSTGQMSFASYQASFLTVSGALNPAPWIPIGGSAVPAIPPAQDFYAALSTSAGTASEGGAQVNGSTSVFTLGAGLSADPTVPGSLAASTRSFYYKNATSGANFASYLLAGAWTCVQWSGALATFMTGITHRIDGILTTGDLVSTEGGVLRLYDTTGTGRELYAISLGGLQFSYEAYIGSTPYVFFSLPMSVGHGDWAFNMYAVPTSSMRSLGG